MPLSPMNALAEDLMVQFEEHACNQRQAATQLDTRVPA
jgi:hypothetical protein